MDALKIIGLSVVAAIVYGIVHNQVTARVCIEYFTIGHPAVFATESPTLLGLGWRIIATWWVGLLLGAPLAFAAIHGLRPRRSARTLIRPMAMLLACMGAMSLAAGVTATRAAELLWVDGNVPAWINIGVASCSGTETELFIRFCGTLLPADETELPPDVGCPQGNQLVPFRIRGPAVPADWRSVELDGRVSLAPRGNRRPEDA